MYKNINGWCTIYQVNSKSQVTSQRTQTIIPGPHTMTLLTKLHTIGRQNSGYVYLVFRASPLAAK